MEDWRCSCLCFELIPSVTERSALFVKELSFPQTVPTDNAFFNRNWTGACWGRWARTGTIAGPVRRLEVGLLWKNKKEGGLARVSSVSAPMPKLVPL